MSVEQWVTALAEIGYKSSGEIDDVPAFRGELRRACRSRGIKVRTGVTWGHLWACTPDCLPAEEPWRGAVVHAEESGVYSESTRRLLDAMGRLVDPS